MVIIDGKAVKVDTCSLITCRRQRKRGRQSQLYIPDEIWLEILSRLPIKSLFICRSVCKSWKKFFIILHRKIQSNLLNVPLCGLLLLSFSLFTDPTEVIYCFSYFCLKNKQNFITRENFFENNSIYSSGFESGLLSDLSFDFSMIHKGFLGTTSEFFSFVLHGGLLLLTSEDCTSQMHNPATKQIHFMPKSEITEKYGFRRHTRVEEPGLIIQLPPRNDYQKCRFMVVRFCFQMRIMEVYYSSRRKWIRCPLKLGKERLSSITYQLQNYVAFFESGVLSLYVLVNEGRGMAIKFKGRMNSKMKQYCFPLPEVVLGDCRARLWECEETLYLTFYKITELWIWKAGSTQVDTWEWVPLLEFSSARQLCMPVAREHLCEVVLNRYVRVVPLACHPNLPLLYLAVKSSLFSYNLKTDTLNRIGEIKDFDKRCLDFVHTFKPCFRLMDASNDGLVTPTLTGATCS